MSGILGGQVIHLKIFLCRCTKFSALTFKPSLAERSKQT